jgi:hypothetical protein
VVSFCLPEEDHLKFDALKVTLGAIYWAIDKNNNGEMPVVTGGGTLLSKRCAHTLGVNQ